MVRVLLPRQIFIHIKVEYRFRFGDGEGGDECAGGECFGKDDDGRRDQIVVLHADPGVGADSREQQAGKSHDQYHGQAAAQETVAQHEDEEIFGQVAASEAQHHFAEIDWERNHQQTVQSECKQRHSAAYPGGEHDAGECGEGGLPTEQQYEQRGTEQVMVVAGTEARIQLPEQEDAQTQPDQGIAAYLVSENRAPRGEENRARQQQSEDN